MLGVDRRRPTKISPINADQGYPARCVSGIPFGLKGGNLGDQMGYGDLWIR